MKILGIETTCDETGAAVVEDGRLVLSNIVASSANLHEKYGGVVPEVAAREQIKVIITVIEEDIAKAARMANDPTSIKISADRQIPNIISAGRQAKQIQNPDIQNWVKKNIDAIAISHGPGLIGSLLIGVETAKALALVWEKPLIGINHLVGHIYANWISLDNKPRFPLIALIVSGGHTDLILMRKHGDFKLIGKTLDDSAGEAFDKVARLLGLGYPGGPEIERLASQIRSTKSEIRNIKLPRPMIASKDFNFSFSGLKTAVVNLVHSDEAIVHSKQKKSAAAEEFQKAVVDVLVKKTIDAAQKFDCNSIVVGGGVAANTLLRSQMADAATRISRKVFFPSKTLSVDNGAMIAAAAFFVNKKMDPLELQADPGLHF